MKQINHLNLLERLKLRALTPDVNRSKIERALIWKTLVLWALCALVIGTALFCVVKIYG